MSRKEKLSGMVENEEGTAETAKEKCPVYIDAGHFCVEILSRAGYALTIERVFFNSLIDHRLRHSDDLKKAVAYILDGFPSVHFDKGVWIFPIFVFPIGKVIFWQPNPR